jgi:hypothetical protein
MGGGDVREFVAPGKLLTGQQLLRHKYWLKIVGDFFGRLLRHRNAVIAIELD